MINQVASYWMLITSRWLETAIDIYQPHPRYNTACPLRTAELNCTCCVLIINGCLTCNICLISSKLNPHWQDFRARDLHQIWWIRHRRPVAASSRCASSATPAMGGTCPLSCLSCPKEDWLMSGFWWKRLDSGPWRREAFLCLKIGIAWAGSTWIWKHHFWGLRREFSFCDPSFLHAEDAD